MPKLKSLSGNEVVAILAPVKLLISEVKVSVGNNDERADLTEEQLRDEENFQVEKATVAGLGPAIGERHAAAFAQEQELLQKMSDIADDAKARPDARVRRLVEWIRGNMCPNVGATGARWNDIRIIVFTEYDDTRRYLQQQLDAAIEKSDRADQRIEVYHGPTPLAKREEIKQAFNADPAKHPIRILIATDAAREGLNLQTHCWNLFHFDVPWNPSRMEQRNGRIDRKLQPHEEVFCHYFVYEQRKEDQILRTIVKKTERIREELGGLPQVVEARLASMPAGGIPRRSIPQLQAMIDASDLEEGRKQSILDDLEPVRQRQDDLREQVEQLRTICSASKKSIGFREEEFREAISCALRMSGAEPLKRLDAPTNDTQRFAFPVMDQHEGADPTCS